MNSVEKMFPCRDISSSSTGSANPVMSRHYLRIVGFTEFNYERRKRHVLLFPLLPQQQWQRNKTRRLGHCNQSARGRGLTNKAEADRPHSVRLECGAASPWCCKWLWQCNAMNGLMTLTTLTDHGST
jgi:hypothetical protein